MLRNGAVLASVVAAVVGTTPVQANTSTALIATGWIQGRGEIRIYPNKDDVGKMIDGSCISGVMAHGKHLPSRYAGIRVDVYGKLMSKQTLDDIIASGSSIGVENYCGGNSIAIISRIVPHRGQ